LSGSARNARRGVAESDRRQHDNKGVPAQSALIRSAQRILAHDLPMIPVAFTGYEVAAAKSVSGFRSHDVQEVWCDQLSI
jgi:hypothetical protein